MSALEFSHDGDFYINYSNFDDLRATETVITNPRLKKYQMVKYGMAYDIYLERQHGLLVTYRHLSDASMVIDGVRVACLEHLLLLKLAAYGDRGDSEKGHKDERDMIRILYMLAQQKGGPKTSLLVPYMDSALRDDLKRMSKSPQIVELTDGSLRKARLMRGDVEGVIRKIVART